MERKKTSRKNFNGLVVILGPTASGKTDLSIKLAKKFNGEIVSADSRQVYKGMDIGSGKVTKKEMSGIPHHLLDVANPKRRFSIAQYQKLTLKAIKDIQKRGKLPFLVGGTGFYIQSIVDGIVIPEVKPDWKLRKKLELQPLPELVKRLAKLDPVRAGIIDQNNSRRVIRALEIVLKLKHPVPSLARRSPWGEGGCQIIQIGILKPKNELKGLIKKRLQKRLKQGMVAEVKKLRKNLSWKCLEEFGLEYRYVARLLRYASHCGQAQYKQAYNDMINNIQKESWHLVKKQMTWFKRDKRIVWIKKYKEAEFLLNKFLQN